MRRNHPDDSTDLAMICLLVAIYAVWLVIVSGRQL